MSCQYGSQSLRKTAEDRQFLKRALPANFARLYKPVQVIGRGSSGIVFSASTPDGRTVAVKQVLENPNIKYREHEILQSLDHRNLLQLHDFFMIPGPSPRSRLLNYVTEYYPMNLKQFCETNEVEPIYPKLFAFQIFAGLANLHANKIVHRDICLENIYVNPIKGTLVIGDFSEAKKLRSSEKNSPYLVTRPYRAPELIYGSETYGTAIDIWASGCLLSLILLGAPLFKGSSELSQLNDMVRILGPPDDKTIESYHGSRKPTVPNSASTSLDAIFKSFNSDTVSFLKLIFIYDPSKRITAKESIMHPYFNDLFRGSAILPSGLPMPPLYRGDIDFLHGDDIDVE